MLVQPASVAAEWALWGKDAHDTEYHLLGCSTGIFSSHAFTFVLDRYSPGTLEELPQITVSWIRDPDNGHPSHLAVAIHETAADDPPGVPARSRYDAGGREIVFVRYFCVAYDDLARNAVSYEALFNGLRKHMLPKYGRKKIRVKLQAQPISTQAHELAELVAALLLTTRPVCILGADRTPTIDRLRFIDLVMSLLPYGMRSCLSASTWVNSNFKEHNLRLFFATAPRPGGGRDGYNGDRQKSDDIVVYWKRPDKGCIEDTDVLAYLNWLQSQDVGHQMAGEADNTGGPQE